MERDKPPFLSLNEQNYREMKKSTIGFSNIHRTELIPTNDVIMAFAKVKKKSVLLRDIFAEVDVLLQKNKHLSL